MPTGSPVASQADKGPSQKSRNVKQLRLATTARPVLGTLAIVAMPFLWSRPVLAAAPIMRAIKISGVRDELVWPTLCGTAGMAVFFLFRAAIRSAQTAVARSPNRSVPAASAEHFVEDAQRLHIDPQIARQTFQLLTSLVSTGGSIGVNDELRGALQLSDYQIGSLLSALPELCDRSILPADAAVVLTVYDLLHQIESLPRLKSGQIDSVAVTTPATSPLADLKNASPRDSRFRTRAHFSGIKRRASDYPGPYRRATDRRPDENYAGPMRRASDRKDADATGDQRTGDRRSSERRAFVASENSEPARQHRAVSADKSLVNLCLDMAPNQAGGDPKQGEATAAATLQHH